MLSRDLPSLDFVEDIFVVLGALNQTEGVVIIEDIWRLKSVLKAEKQTRENLTEALNELKKKIPSRDVLKKTKIGHTVNRLTKHPDVEVSNLATVIVTTWKEHFERKLDRPQIEVKTDRKTESMRRAGRKHLGASLGLRESHNLVEQIERETFHQHKRLISSSYRRTMRTLVFTLKHQEGVRSQMLSQTLEVKDLVSRHKKEAKTS